MAIARLYFDAWSSEDPRGPSLGELEDSYARELRADYNGLGGGSFTVNRRDPHVTALVQPDYLVRVRLVAGGPFAWDDSRYVGAFWIGEGRDKLLGPNEQAAEEWQRAGRGPLAYLERAVIYPEGADDDGQHSWLAGMFGAVAKELLDDALARDPSPIPDLTYDFTATLDSAGNAWSPFTGKFRLPTGLDYLAMIAKLQSISLFAEMTPALELRLFETDYGTDRTGEIEFTEGVNIRTAATRVIHASTVKSRVIVQGTLDAGALTFREVVNDSIEEVPTIGRREAFVRYQAANDTASLDRAGLQFLNRTKRQHDGPDTIGVTIGDGTEGAAGHYVPFTDYFPGDLVRVHMPPEYEHRTVRIAALHLVQTPANEVDVTIEFEDTPFSGASGPDVYGDSKSGASGCGDCPGGTGGAGDDPITIENGGLIEGAAISLHSRYYRLIYPELRTDSGWVSTLESHAGSGNTTNVSWPTAPCDIGLGAFTNVGIQSMLYRFSLPADSSYVGASAFVSWVQSGGGDSHCLSNGVLLGVQHKRFGPYYVYAGPTPGTTPAPKVALGLPIPGLLDGDDSSSRIYVGPNALPWLALFGILVEPGFRAKAGLWCGWGGCDDECGDISISTVSLKPLSLAPGAFGWATLGPVGAQDGMNRLFTLLGGYDLVRSVSLNGLELPDIDWLADDGTSLELLGRAPLPTDTLLAEYHIPQ